MLGCGWERNLDRQPVGECYGIVVVIFRGQTSERCWRVYHLSGRYAHRYVLDTQLLLEHVRSRG
jgi:hypothetical protein